MTSLAVLIIEKYKLVRHEETGHKPRHTYVVFAAALHSFAAIPVCNCGRLWLQLQFCGSHLQTN